MENEKLKKIITSIEKSPRELECEKRVNEIIEEYAEYDTPTEYHVFDEEKEIVFTNEDFKKDNDGLSRRQYTAKLSKIEITNELLNTGNVLIKEVEKELKDKDGNVIKDENGKPKTEIKQVKYIERLNTFTLIKLYIK